MSRSPRRNPLAELPLPVVFLLLAALWTGLQLLLHLGSLDGVRVATTAASGLLFSAVLTAVVAGRRHRLGSAAQARGFLGALRSGTVSPGADRAAWRSELDRAERRSTRLLALALALSLLPIGLGVWGLFSVESRTSGGLLVLLFVALDLAALGWRPLEARRRQRLRAALDDAEQDP